MLRQWQKARVSIVIGCFIISSSTERMRMLTEEEDHLISCGRPYFSPEGDQSVLSKCDADAEVFL